MTDASVTAHMREAGGDEAAAAVRARCIHLPAPERSDTFGAQFDRFGEARIVLLGEATHGTSDFYAARDAITRRLVAEHGFNIVAVEADWPQAAGFDRRIRGRKSGVPEMAETEPRFPAWMWHNEEVERFLGWLEHHNGSRPMADRVEFRGLDVYSLRDSARAVLAYLDRVDPDEAQLARKRYGCLTPWQAEPASYGRAVLRGQGSSCEDAVVRQLQELLDKRLSYMAKDGEDFFDAAQNARIVRAAEQYYRIMYHGSRESWNLRDRHMFDTLQAVMKARGPGAKAVVWAHNSHVGNASATAMGWEGEFNIGELCKTAYGIDAVAIGFGTDRGTVIAADDWDGPEREMSVLPARADSCERVFRQSGVARSLTDLRDPASQDLRERLSKPRLERAIGVIYRPDSELYSHYFEAVLPDQFDAFVWFEETRAVTRRRA